MEKGRKRGRKMGKGEKEEDGQEEVRKRRAIDR